VAPAEGQINTVVTIAGSNLRGGGGEVVSVTLAGVSVSDISSENDTLVVVTASGSSDTGAGDVVLTADSGAVVTAADGFEYLTAGAIEAVAPDEGQVGTNVLITGSNLLGGGSSVARVTFGSADATVGEHNDTHVYVAAGAASAGAGDVVVYADTGATMIFDDGFTYLTESNITDIDPSNGQINTAVTISGTNLLGGGASVASVTFGDDAGVVASGNNDKVVVAAPNVAAGVVDVVITADSGATTTRGGGFVFQEAGSIDAIAPATGQIGTVVTISGSALRGYGGEVATVELAGNGAAISFENDTLVVATAAAGDAGDGDVLLTADTGATVTSRTGSRTSPPGRSRRSPPRRAKRAPWSRLPVPRCSAAGRGSRR
jgi:hypothetical protein